MKFKKIYSVQNSNSNIPSITYLSNAFKKPFPQITCNYSSRHEVGKVIKSLKFSNLHRCEISVKIIKRSSAFISSPLTNICIKSLSSGIFPEHLKYSDIRTNYRSISLLTFSKFFKKLVFTRLLQHFTNNSILSKEKFSFKSNSSTDKTIFKLISEI